MVTCLILSFFLFFLINGSLKIKEVLVNLEDETMLFSSPLLVGSEKENETYKKVGKVETSGNGWGLLGFERRSEEGGMLSSKVEDLKEIKFERERLQSHLKKANRFGL